MKRVHLNNTLTDKKTQKEVRHYYIENTNKWLKSLPELPTCKDDPVELMPQVRGRTHVVGLEDIPAKGPLNMIINKSLIGRTILMILLEG